MTAYPPAAYPPPTGRMGRPVVVWDLVTTIVLLVLAVIIAAVLTFSAFFLVFASDPCGASTACDTGRMGAGFFLALLGPGAVTLVTVIVAVVLLVVRRRAFWVPIVGILLSAGVWVGGAVLVVSGVLGATF